MSSAASTGQGPVRAATATLSGSEAANEDRVVVGRNAVVVLDGATGTDAGLRVTDYVGHLAATLVEILDSAEDVPLREALGRALSAVVERFRLVPGASPSSTVSIVRRRGDDVDLLALGDSPVYLGPDCERFTDDRLASLDLPSRAALFERLASGTGYDETYAALLRQTSTERAPMMNRPGGYWIAEATPAAADHARIHTVSVDTTSWAVMLTDGADTPMRHLDIKPPSLVERSEAELLDALDELHRWESTDPNAHALPRYKTHDDKTLAVVSFR